MAIKTAKAKWEGNLPKGKGEMELGSKLFQGAYTFASRFEEGKGTNPEELIGAAHAGCYSMALSHSLAEAGFTPTSVETMAKVHLEKQPDGFAITTIELITEAVVPNIEQEKFIELANAAKEGCPVSKALKSTPIELSAKLL